MAYRIRGVIRLDDSGNANLGIASATEFDGKVSAKAISEQTDGAVGDVTGADELLLHDTDTGNLLRVTVDEFIGGAGIGTIVSDFTNLNVSGILTTGNIQNSSDMDITAGSGSSISLNSQTYLGVDANFDAGATVHALNVFYPESGIVLGEASGLSPDNLNLRTVSGDTVGEIQLNENLQVFRVTSKPDFNFADTLVNIDGNTDTITVGCSIIPDTNVTYDLGSATNRFRDLYLEGNTIYLGDSTLSVVNDNLEYRGEQVITGAGGTINTDYADITSVNAGIITATQIGSPGAGNLNLDGDFLPTNNRQQDLGHATKSWRRIYIRTGPKAIEFEDSNVGLGFTVNAQGDNILEFDGHELFAGDGDIGHHGNLNNIYASGIVSATSFKHTAGPTWTNGTGTPEGSVTAPVGSLYSRTDGGAGTTLYVKESGTGNTGWVAK